MKKIFDIALKKYYIENNNIDSFFAKDPIDFINLFFYEKGEHLALVGEQLNYLHFLVDGKLKVYTSKSDGRSLLLKLCTPLELIGDIEFLRNDKCHSNIEVLQDTYCLSISVKDIHSYFLNDSVFLRKICEELAIKLRYSSLLNSMNYLYPLDNRLAKYILFIAGEKKYIEELNLSETAELLGTSYRHLLRVLKNFETTKIIERNNKAITVLDFSSLKKLSEDIYY